MSPLYRSGDHLLTLNWTKLKAGDVVAFESGKKKFLKRIDKVSGYLVYVSGDNKKLSANIGPVRKRDIIGKVILRY